MSQGSSGVRRGDLGPRPRGLRNAPLRIACKRTAIPYQRERCCRAEDRLISDAALLSLVRRARRISIDFREA